MNETKEVLAYLTKISETHNVKILYAAESGSRAWGFASADSDYDVRFLYAHPLEHYLSFNVELADDTIQKMYQSEDLDLVGWDIRKALHLFTRSNGLLLEWLRSPICYKESNPAIATLRTVARNHFNPTALCYHYYRLGKNNAREFLKGDTVSLKKYLYVLRAFIAVDFIRERCELPYVDFPMLLEHTSTFNEDVRAIKSEVEALINHKRKTRELGEGKRIPALDTYISQALDVNEKEFDSYRKGGLRQRDWDAKLNAIFREAIGYTPESVL